jgi:hypothetical protein
MEYTVSSQWPPSNLPHRPVWPESCMLLIRWVGPARNRTPTFRSPVEFSTHWAIFANYIFIDDSCIFHLDRIDPNNVLEIVFQNSARQWRVSVSYSLQTWHSIACSWHPSDGLLCLIDLTIILKGSQKYPTSKFGALTLGKSSTIPNTFAHASVSSLAIWERKLTSSEFQSLYNCMGIMPRTYQWTFILYTWCLLLGEIVFKLGKSHFINLRVVRPFYLFMYLAYYFFTCCPALYTTTWVKNI